MNGWCLVLVCAGVAMVKVEGISDFLKAKVHQHFVLADCNGDGTIQREDYNCIVDHIMELPGYDKIDPDTFHNVVAQNAWDAFPKTDMTEDEYVAAVNTLPAEDIALVAKNLSKFMFVAWAQLNGQDPGMNVTEVGNEYYSLGKRDNLPEQAEKGFRAMDADSNGYVSQAEYQETAAKFLTLNDEDDDSKYFFGELNEG